MEPEHTANGIEFGTGFGQRLDWLEESAAALEQLFAGQRVTSRPGDHYAFDDLVLLPRPLQERLPIMIGGAGEKKTLRTVARHADMWNAMGTQEFLRHKVEVLQRHCDDAGRDIAEIEFTGGCKPVIRSTAEEARRLGGPDGPQPDAAGRRRGRRHVLGRDAGGHRGQDGRREGCRLPRSSPSSRPRTTTRPSSAGSARSARWSTEARQRPAPSRGQQDSAGGRAGPIFANSFPGTRISRRRRPVRHPAKGAGNSTHRPVPMGRLAAIQAGRAGDNGPG